jgi:hypothetical protein
VETCWSHWEVAKSVGRGREKKKRRKLGQILYQPIKSEFKQSKNGERCDGSVTKHVEGFPLGHSNGPSKVKSNDYEFCLY